MDFTVPTLGGAVKAVLLPHFQSICGINESFSCNFNNFVLIDVNINSL